MFRHSLNKIWGFYVNPVRYVFKLIGCCPEDRPKMRPFFEVLSILNIKAYFLVSVHHNNDNIELNYQYKIYCPEKGCFFEVCKYFILKNWHEKTGNGFIDYECFAFWQHCYSFRFRTPPVRYKSLKVCIEEDYSLNKHGTQYGLSQHNKILQNVEV